MLSKLIAAVRNLCFSIFIFSSRNFGWKYGRLVFTGIVLSIITVFCLLVWSVLKVYRIATGKDTLTNYRRFQKTYAPRRFGYISGLSAGPSKLTFYGARLRRFFLIAALLVCIPPLVTLLSELPSIFALPIKEPVRDLLFNNGNALQILFTQLLPGLLGSLLLICLAGAVAFCVIRALWGCFKRLVKLLDKQYEKRGIAYKTSTRIPGKVRWVRAVRYEE